MTIVKTQPAPTPADAPGIGLPVEMAAGPSLRFLRAIPHEFARRHLVLSAGNDGETEVLLVAEHTRPWIIHNVGIALGVPVSFRVAAEGIAAAIDNAYATLPEKLSPDVAEVRNTDPAEIASNLEQALRDAESDLLSIQGKSPAVRLVDLILFEALLKGASDVHLQPARGRTLVRYRLDGVLHTARELPGALAASVTSRVKVMARLDVAEQRTPQDGRATVTIGGAERGALASRRIDLRVSTLPSTYGERIVLRLLDPSRSPHLKSFAALGMAPETETKYLAQVNRSSGIVLSTGPTGSGKTTTLYATLAWLSTSYAGSRGCELNMMTIEDPVEYDLAGFCGEANLESAPRLSISQTQVDPKKAVTFATGLRHMLRQDPDVIMVGEIRDQETARIAIQASLTGHLVLSTLHTSDAASAIARLIDLSIEPFLVSSSLSAVLAQRLVRTLHKACEGKGCPACLNSGYKGRTGVFELLILDGTIKELIGSRASADQIKRVAQELGMVSLRQAGEDLIRRHITSHEEVGRVIEAVEEQK